MRKLTVLFFLVSSALSLTAAAQPGRVRDVYEPRLPALPQHGRPLLSAVVSNKRGQGARNYLSDLQYQQIRYGALEVIRRFPPRQYFYVPVGRSPTPIAAFLENLSEPGASLSNTLPASNLREGQIAGREAAWFAHLDQFIPPEVLRDGRSILLVDRSTTGTTLAKVKQITEQYVAQRGSQAKVEVIAFSRRPIPIPYIDVTTQQELVEMNQDNYVPWAEWPRYEVGVNAPATLQRQPSYDLFKARLLELMQRDPQLSQQLRSLGV